MLTNKKEIRIEWGDCDPLGIVYYPRYFEFFDACTNALFERALGYAKKEMMSKYAIAGIPMVETSARFFVPSSFGDLLVVQSYVSKWGTASFSVHHKLFKSNELAVEGFEKRVWTVHLPGEPKKIKGQAIPRELMEKFL